MTTYGECVVTRIDDPLEGMQLCIDHADPRVLISPQLLDEVAQNPPGSPATFNGEVLRIQGINRTVIYRITGQILNGDNWRDPCMVGEWPD